MPSIKDRMGRPAGFVAVDSPKGPPPQSPNTVASVGVNPFIRCPLPPLNVNTDTLRQFDESGVIPTRRVIPLPVTTVAGGNVTQVTNVTTNQSTSGGGSSGGGTTLAPATAVINVPALGPNGTFVTSIPLSKTFQLIQITATQAVEVRVYGSSSAQGMDISRATDTPLPYETFQGIITDLVFDTPPYKWVWQNRIAANGDATASSTTYFTVVNPSSIAVGASTLTIVYLPLEA